MRDEKRAKKGGPLDGVPLSGAEAGKTVAGLTAKPNVLQQGRLCYEKSGDAYQ